jgi:hypothetical protein
VDYCAGYVGLAALALRPHDAGARMAKAWVFERKSEYRSAIAEAEAAIDVDPNNPNAVAFADFCKVFLGRSEDGVAGLSGRLA